MFSSQAWGELGGQEPWTSGDKVGDGRNIGRIEAAGVPNGKNFLGTQRLPVGGWRCTPSGSCSWILEKELRLWGWGGEKSGFYYQT